MLPFRRSFGRPLWTAIGSPKSSAGTLCRGFSTADGLCTESPRKRCWGRICVPDGQRYAIWSSLNGACRQVDGPQQVWSFGSEVQPLVRHVAGPGQYLQIFLVQGGVEFKRGPASLWEDPMLHSKVTVQNALEVGSHEVLVVYSDTKPTTEEGRKVARSTIHGPALYMPSGLEWLHRFSWHGTDPSTLNTAIQRKLPNLLSFSKLRLSPDQLFYDIPEIRTRDDALLTLKLMLFVQLVDVERMLDSTHDPVSEFMNAAAADLVDFVGSRSFEDFKKDANELNSLSAYPNLTARADLVGYDLSKILFRGYSATNRIQQMHDEAIHKRTELQLQKETQQQEHDLKDFKIDRDSLRAERLADLKLKHAQERQAMELESVEHDLKVSASKASAELEQQRREHEHALIVADELHAQSLRHQAENHARAEAHYRQLRDLNVDLSRYLSVVARGAPHRVIEVDAASKDGCSAPRVHIHSEG